MKLLPETIREIPIFSGLSREDIDKVIGKMEECSFSAGTIIFSQGDRGDTFYFIESGAVQVLVKAKREHQKRLPCWDRTIGLEKRPCFPAKSVPQPCLRLRKLLYGSSAETLGMKSLSHRSLRNSTYEWVKKFDLVLDCHDLWGQVLR